MQQISLADGARAVALTAHANAVRVPTADGRTGKSVTELVRSRIEQIEYTSRTHDGAPTLGDPLGFVYAIFDSQFLFLNVFAVNMLRQYRSVARRRDDLSAEHVYLLLSLTAKSMLAWRVFAGTLQPA